MEVCKEIKVVFGARTTMVEVSAGEIRGMATRN